MQDLIKALRSSPRLTNKQKLMKLWDIFPRVCEVEEKEVILGDDAAAIEIGDGYLLLAAEGVYPQLLKSNPYLSGRTSVLTNVNDIYAMGGRPLAILDVLFSSEIEQATDILRGIRDNASRYNVPIVGGHFADSSDSASLSVFILGKARRLLSSFTAKIGDDLVLISSLTGKYYAGFNFWDSSSSLSSEEAIRQLELLPQIAEDGIADTAKDISMAGIIGSTVMLLECSGVGAEIYIDKIPTPIEIPLEHWLLTFPSYGFVLSIRPDYTHEIKNRFRKFDLTCEIIGKAIEGPNVFLVHGSEDRKLFLDLKTDPMIGINRENSNKVING